MAGRIYKGEIEKDIRFEVSLIELPQRGIRY